ncbi:MAG: 30S ribosomal protein S15 [Parcubacteria group bacterium]|nr:30S ribosomal protein S15 [Parcubacteria group bacterium]
MLTKQKKANVIKKTAKHESDTGSAAVQIGLLSRRIDELASHLKKNHKDNHSRRGLLQMVADRRSHLKYLKKHDKKEYDKVVTELGLKASE